MSVTLDLSLFGLIHVLLIVGNNSLGKGLSDRVDLRDVTSASDSDPDVQVLESLEAEQQDGLEDLGTQGLRLQEFDGRSVDSEDPLSAADGGNSHGVLLPAEALGQLALGL